MLMYLRFSNLNSKLKIIYTYSALHVQQQQLLFWQSRHVILLRLGFHHQFIETQVQSGNPNLNEITLHVVHVMCKFVYQY